MDVTSTLRPKERAYLMHWAWMIVKKDTDPRTVPALAGVAITWRHGSKDASKKAAREMVDAFGVGGPGAAPALASRHTEGKAVDTQVRWTGALKIKAEDGKVVTIGGGPRDGTNPELIGVGATYGVVHLKDAAKNPPHGSTDGR